MTRPFSASGEPGERRKTTGRRSNIAGWVRIAEPAARQMREDGWWWADTALTDRAIKRRILGEMLRLRG